jgi:SAM-dependent MidA family methyltransferase
MATSPKSSTPVSAEFLAAFRKRADGQGRMNFAAFMELALYHPELGYYRRTRPRVGYGAGTDFFTATTSGPLFGELVVAACTEILRANERDPTAHTFVEIGAEPGSDGVLTGVSHPFRAAKTVRIGEPLAFPEHSVVFSNELFDAQPFVRSICRHGRWVETGVTLQHETFIEAELESAPPYVPGHAAEGYRFDQPWAAAALARKIASQPWRGLFVALDYGKTLRDLTEETPGGTARAYFRHTQTNDLLANPGEQDLTCHVCWDWITDALLQSGFAAPTLTFQETFFIRHAGPFIAALTAAEATRLSPRKLALMQLLHPSHLGQKFQVLHAVR